MLDIKKTITVTGSSKTEDGVTIATMQFILPDSGRSTSNVTIVDAELYESNLTTVRGDIDEFNTKCRTLEDAEVSE